jgi:uncharacterized protein YdeI (YjbR/CyaY-like superfamily)
MAEVSEFYARDRAAWRGWLEKNHDKEKAVWLIYDKGPNRALTWDAIVQEELCFGWIDSKAGRVSDTQSKMYISPRNPKSGWSKINKAHVEYLVAHNLMRPAGQKAIDIAKQNGAWESLDNVENMVMPKDLIAALAKNKQAKKYFNAFSGGSKKMILFWIYSAKKDETRAARVAKTVELAAQDIKAR